MALTFIEPKRQRQYLILLLVVIVLVVSFLVWNYFLAKPASPVSKPTPPAEIKINFEILKNPILEELQPFEEIPPFEEGIGRENPFTPY
jgi:flagellar basal body-associated protein FliL